MAEFLLRYADPRGQMHEQTAVASTEREARDRLTQQGYLVYSVKAKDRAAKLGGSGSQPKTVNLEKFLIFNQQFVTLIRAGLPILKSLDLLADRLTDEKLTAPIRAVRDDVRTGTILSDAFEKQKVFPAIYVTSVLAGEKSGSLVEVLDRFITYQKLTLAIRKKIITSLLYPAVLIVLVASLIVFLVTYVVPNFADLYTSMQAKLPLATRMLIAVGTTARSYVLVGFVFFEKSPRHLTLDAARNLARLAHRLALGYDMIGEPPVLGFDGVPEAGERFRVVEHDRRARQLAARPPAQRSRGTVRGTLCPTRVSAGFHVRLVQCGRQRRQL